MKSAVHDRGGVRAGQVLAPAAAPRTERRASALAVILAFGGPIGCGIGLTASSAETPTLAGDAVALTSSDSGVARPDAPTKFQGTAPVIDAGAADNVAHAVASPLCGTGNTVDAGASCSPDEGSCTPSASAYDADAGAEMTGGRDADGEPAAASYACRVTVTRAEAGAASAAAVCTLAGTGRTEAPCHASADCAAGFECVVDTVNTYADGASTTGICRHYCCDNSCEAASSFCDIESTLGGSASVPVCVPQTSADVGATCVLLDDMTCASGLTCQVVNATTGEVACVTPGLATAGQACETAKCAAGFSCVGGYFPNRQCVQLCNHDNDNCPTGYTCAADSALTGQNMAIGVCTPSP